MVEFSTALQDHYTEFSASFINKGITFFSPVVFSLSVSQETYLMDYH